MTASSTTVIVGGGLAGAKTAEALRDRGYDGRIVLVGSEPHHPYERPSLSKDNLVHGQVGDKLLVHAKSWYADHGVELLLSTTADTIDLPHRLLALSDGSRLDYDALVLATGAQPRQLPVPGADLRGVHYLRTIEDSEALREALVGGPRVLIVGGGWIGLEVAAAAHAHGAHITVLEQGPLPLRAVLGPRVAEILVSAHRGRGVHIRTDVQVTEFREDGHRRVASVRLADGSELPADIVVVGVGAKPNVALAERAGLPVANGILVDDRLRTSASGVYAAGDVANAHHPFLGHRVRVEHWANALHQPETVAAGITGTSDPYDRLPYFFSDQYDLGLEYTGHVDLRKPHQVVLRGDESSGRFLVFWLQHGAVAAAMTVNTWGLIPHLEALIRARAIVAPTRLSDDTVPIQHLRSGGEPFQSA